jgi:DNA (cytosine-5)-methyltransferase 1
VNELALFAGAGGGILGGHLLGWRTVCAVEWEQYPASVLCARQNDKILPPFPIWDDVQTFDGKPWRGIVDVVSGGFPCQDISIAGKGDGLDGERSGMWREMARIIGEVMPQYVFVENSPILTTRGLGVVLADLSTLGFDAKWGVVSAANVGAPHRRDRIWIYAYANKQYGRGKSQQPNDLIGEKIYDESCGLRTKVSHTDSAFIERNQCPKRVTKESTKPIEHSWWEIEPNVGRVANGVASRVDRLKSIGNGQVPLCAAIAWNILLGELT